MAVEGHHTLCVDIGTTRDFEKVLGVTNRPERAL